ncbi:MAG TPA: hypothetical protein VFG71_11935 [Nitrospiraceae bacterium]|nr:hypothetical protein [Nitrospiraceae bacterium]
MMDRRPRGRNWFRALTLAGAVSAAVPALANDFPADQTAVQQHADEAFQGLEKSGHSSGQFSGGRPDVSHSSSSLRPDELRDQVEPNTLIGHGQGDLSKGKLVCQRVSELAARADLAKQIRVLVKERATDRIRERTGREPEQDIEVVREELVQEYLQGVKIVDRRLDEAQKTCSATAVMPAHPPLANPLQGPPPAATAR